MNDTFLLKLYINYCYPRIINIWKNSNTKAKMIKIEGLVKKQNCIYEKFKSTVMPHGRHIYPKASDTEKATMCAYYQSDHALPHWKCVLQ